MASFCFAELLLAHYKIEQEPIRVPAETTVDEQSGEELVVSWALEEQPPRDCTLDDVPEVPDRIAYDLAVEHLGISRCEAAFRRYTFDRTGSQAEPDPKAVEFWDNLRHVEIIRNGERRRDFRNTEEQDGHLPFAVQAAVRERAYAAMGEELANDYIRATAKAVGDIDETAGFNLGVMLLATLVPE